MTIQELASKPNSQGVFDRNRQRHNISQFQKFKTKAKVINNANELLPGLNDISDAFEALPNDIIKYFTLLREIDAKCINAIPVVNKHIEQYINNLHAPHDSSDNENLRLQKIKNKINEIIPCLEEKMHVTSIATDVIAKHLFRINNDYKVIIQNNEIPESIRIGPLNHPAMIMDSSSPSDRSNPNRSAQSSRLETRREALAAKKQINGKDEESATSKKEQTPIDKRKRSRKEPNGKEVNTFNSSMPPVTSSKTIGLGVSGNEVSRPSTPGPKKKLKKSEDSNEPTYCYCNQVSFGEMVGCDGDDCKREWFHLPCIGFKNPPKGKWYCDDCLIRQKKLKKI